MKRGHPSSFPTARSSVAPPAGLVGQHARADRVAGDPRRRRLRDQQVRQRQSGAPGGPQGPGRDQSTGKLIWRSNTSKVPPCGHGGFFSSPAVAFGHVYAARDDGTVYAFDEKTGKVAWSLRPDRPRAAPLGVALLFPQR
jgi:outer membrane protein assembly factor BamB